MVLAVVVFTTGVSVAVLVSMSDSVVFGVPVVVEPAVFPVVVVVAVLAFVQPAPTVIVEDEAGLDEIRAPGCCETLMETVSPFLTTRPN
jgi:hypothetical protein